MEIRRASISDVPHLTRLNAHVHDLHVAAEPEIYRETDPDEVTERFRQILSVDGGSEAFIAWLDGAPVGHVVFRAIGRPGHAYAHPSRYLLVDQLAVDAAARRRGVGRALMDAVVTRARELELPQIELDVRSHNRGAMAFYDAIGYGEQSRRLALKL